MPARVIPICFLLSIATKGRRSMVQHSIYLSPGQGSRHSSASMSAIPLARNPSVALLSNQEYYAAREGEVWDM